MLCPNIIFFIYKIGGKLDLRTVRIPSRMIPNYNSRTYQASDI